MFVVQLTNWQKDVHSAVEASALSGCLRRFTVSEIRVLSDQQCLSLIIAITGLMLKLTLPLKNIFCMFIFI